MEDARGREEGPGEELMFKGTEFQFGKIKRKVWGDGADGCTKV